LDEIEAEISASAIVPEAGQVALSAERMSALSARLRSAVAASTALAAADAAHQAGLRQAQAQAALVRDDARHQAETLLEGARVARLREENVQAIIAESREQGEVLVTAAYAYGRSQMEEVLERASRARRHVAAATNDVRVDPAEKRRRQTGTPRTTRRRGLLGFLRGT
jgi:hypothetical protein